MAATDRFTLASLAERPDLATELWSLTHLWPTFLLHDPTADLYYERCERLFADLVFVVEDPDEPGAVQARGFAVPFAMRGDELPDAGWDEVIRWGIQDATDDRPATHVSALEIVIRSEHRGSGLADRLIGAMRAAARARGVEQLVAPVRPTNKHRFPDEDMAGYAARVRADGLPEDPWLRTHVRVGGEIVRVAPRSMTVSGSLAEWREWTGEPFDRPGPTIVGRALVPVIADLDRDLAVYVEPNVWVVHDV
ncbi:MAG: hypothetical protein QNJ12_03640 [Ilumatobacter sp.]|uniref:hypothetical protein n=1 Tax=Ilumatobacter sp. TaxID=1967498 RepID=UPI00263342FD|nr:hypothetical protein [Ilumatobacter sp.]MDJ0767855.1 hypothetical protein [Ilumatobacter sp.]